MEANELGDAEPDRPPLMGRGINYSSLRRRLDAVERRVFRSGWGARVAYALGLQGGVHVANHEFVLPGLTQGARLQMVFASDFHAGPLTDPRLLRRAVSELAKLEPDIVLLGGDYVSLDTAHLRELLEPLQRLRGRYGTFAVLGNHDLWLDDEFVARELRAIGIDVLVNEFRDIETPAGTVRLYGMDDACAGSPEPPGTKSEERVASIVLTHAPIGLRELLGYPFHVALCGHTHGGQIALPGNVPLVLPYGTGDRRYASGEIYLPDVRRRMLVSRGVGMSDLPIRLFAPSEVHRCVLRGE